MEAPRVMKPERSEASRWIKHWMTILGLTHFTVYWWLVEDMEDDSIEDKQFTWASVSVDHQNLHIKLFLSRRYFSHGLQLPGIQPLSVIIGHEMMHAVLSELFDPLMEELQLFLATTNVADEVRGLFAKRWNEAHERAARHLEPILERAA